MFGFDYQIKWIDKNLAGNNGILNIVVKANDLMYCYKDDNENQILKYYMSLQENMDIN